MNKLQKANEYIQKNKEKVNNRPVYHFSPEIGWMNDPNGFSYYKGKYHLFYQYYPYDIVWSDMHWGHAITNDFIKWEYLPVAMANDKVYDANGCFSGSAIEKDGNLYLIYTGHIDPNIEFDRDERQIFERQCIAYSNDGVNFEKIQDNPVIGEKHLPEGYLICDFRDPKVLEVNDVYYCVLSVRNSKRRGEIIMFESTDLVDWTFHSSIYQTKVEENTLLECPDLFRIDNKDVFIFSEMPCDPEFENQVEKKTTYLLGEMDFENGEFHRERKGTLDYSTFYAPQTTEGENGERLLIGWMHRWHQSAPPNEYGYNGMMSLPRQLNIKNGDLIQQPFIDQKKYFKPSVTYENVQLQKKKIDIDGEGTGYLKLSVSPTISGEFTIELNKNENKSTSVEVDVENKIISMDSDYGNQDRIEIKECFSNGDLTLEFYIDLHSVELFVNSGEHVVTFTAYDQNKGRNISIVGEEVELQQVRYEVFRP